MVLRVQSALDIFSKWHRRAGLCSLCRDELESIRLDLFQDTGGKSVASPTKRRDHIVPRRLIQLPIRIQYSRVSLQPNADKTGSLWAHRASTCLALARYLTAAAGCDEGH